MGRVQGKVALITGGARGQGRSHAVRLAEEGADIIVLDALTEQPFQPASGSTEEDLEETVRLVEKTGQRIFARQADVRDFDQVKSVVDEGVAELGRLDIVSANAGITGLPSKSEDIPEEAWTSMLDINLTGVWRTYKAAIPHIRAGGRGGSIILTSSSMGLHAAANLGHYIAAKHGVVGIMRSLAVELAPESIRVNSIHPTTVDTDMIRNESTYRLFRPDLADPKQEDMVEAASGYNKMPIPWIEAIDISNAVLWLASDEARYVTGVPLPVDAGAIL
ncbi:mycofactocin-coupled SDR family oxidoreductase [Aeromicrobium sp. CFBP 8757]|uniref:mycofactocin-coupled SDR family oxidoreductase n=1 Tax=Aeromicrobium sp. CFBP 8757 TaxID=2775288 RepID=UPI00178307F0|nr:mycofactocin-coupled SDR family oxidoreductase [Aeromicrobium sp. CFBP 8757]MBD8605450.1 mycofactocin-coupled SDR family oxidoreductase [Aeromicrobium sp. CFBP 8757]